VNQHLYHVLYGPGSLNHQLFQFVNHHLTNGFLDLLMPLLTYLGGSRMVYWYAAILICWAVVDRKRMPWRYPLIFIVGTLLGLVLEEGLKQLLQVPRPAAALGLARVRVLGELKLKNSLPSGHAVFAFMLATTLGEKRSLAVRTALWCFAAGVAVSRVYVGAHYPLDVVAGGAIGVLAGLMARRVVDHLGRFMGGQRH